MYLSTGISSSLSAELLCRRFQFERYNDVIACQSRLYGYNGSVERLDAMACCMARHAWSKGDVIDRRVSFEKVMQRIG